MTMPRQVPLTKLPIHQKITPYVKQGTTKRVLCSPVVLFYCFCAVALPQRAFMPGLACGVLTILSPDIFHPAPRWNVGLRYDPKMSNSTMNLYLDPAYPKICPSAQRHGICKISFLIFKNLSNCQTVYSAC